MNREEMITEVIRIASRPSPFDDDFELPWFEKQDARRREFLERASDNWLDELLDLFVDQPDWQRVWPDLSFHWEMEIQKLIGDWAHRNPELVIPKVGKLLTVEQARPVMLGAMVEIARPECVPWLKPIVDQISLLTEDEICDVAAALCSSRSPEANELFERMSASVPAEMTNAREEIQTYHDHLNKQLAKQ